MWKQCLFSNLGLLLRLSGARCMLAVCRNAESIVPCVASDRNATRWGSWNMLQLLSLKGRLQGVPGNCPDRRIVNRRGCLARPRSRRLLKGLRRYPARRKWKDPSARGQWRFNALRIAGHRSVIFLGGGRVGLLEERAGVIGPQKTALGQLKVDLQSCRVCFQSKSTLRARERCASGGLPRRVSQFEAGGLAHGP